jgi:hypothetical protein
MTIRKIFRNILVLLGVFIISLIVKQIILNGVPLLSLSKAPSLASSVAPYLTTPGANNFPVYGKDFKLISSHYFDDNQWAVVTVAHLPDNNLASLVIHRINGIYMVVLGPGTSFDGSAAESMPADVGAYLSSRGLLSGTNS